MKKMKFSALLSLCMVPAMFWSSESSAIPSWSRKYNVSCYMCHSGFPQRNAVGEAFQNNGYRFPGATEEALTRQKNVRIGTDEWKKEFPNAPATGSFPQFDALSMTLGGNLVNYTSPQTDATTDGRSKKVFNWSAPNSVSLFYGGSLGDNFTFFGQLSGFNAVSNGTPSPTQIETSTANQITSNARLIYRILPGFNVAMGSSFSPAGNAAWNGTTTGGVTNVNGLLPYPTNYAELVFVRGETGGYAIVAGTSVSGAPGAAKTSSTTNIDDHLYLRGKVKLIGAGLLSGANGDLGNSYNGLDNQVVLGFGLSSATKNTNFTGIHAGETFVYGGDIQGVYKNALIGIAASRDRDLGLTNLRTEAGYFVFPWLFGKLSYSNLATASNATNYPNPTNDIKLGTGYNLRQPTVVPSITAWLAPNVSLTSTYTVFTKEWKESAATSSNVANHLSNQNTFALALSAGF